MNKKNSLWFAVLLCSCLCLAACGSAQNRNPEADGTDAEIVGGQGGEDTSSENASSAEDAGDSGAADDSSLSADLGMTLTDSVYTYGEMTVTIPESWIGKVNVKEADNGFYFVQKASVEKEPDSGYICGFYRSDAIVYNFAGEIPLACTDDTIYYAQEPTDVPCADGPEIMNEYGELMQKLSRLQDSFKVDDANARYACGEYMIFGSDAVEIPEDILINLNSYELWIARNEIFARHGRKFDTYYLQGYFETCSWYQGVTEAKNFDESVLSETEKKNVEKIKAAEDRKRAERPYPVRYKADQTAEEDLDGDGEKEKIRIAFRDTDIEVEPQPFLNIDGKEYDLAEMGAAMICANEDEFYVTDIWSWVDGLEIAVMDYGPSYDLVTHFFRYDGQLIYVGAVEGFPFKEYLGFDGFYMDGVICSEIRADLLSSAYAYGTWWADSTNFTLSRNEGVYRMEYDGLHRILIDLPVYEYMNESADTFVMPAGEEVCFIETDGKEWLGIKSKQNRTIGYVLYRNYMVDTVHKEAGEVFSDLKYFD